MRLWYANVRYSLRLGQVVSVWTPHVSNGEHGSLAVPHAPLFTSVFPERDRSCHFAIHEDGFLADRFRTPLGYDAGESLPNLMALRSFVDGGHDVPDARLLLCVKAVGAKKSSKPPLSTQSRERSDPTRANSHEEERPARRRRKGGPLRRDGGRAPRPLGHHGRVRRRVEAVRDDPARVPPGLARRPPAVAVRRGGHDDRGRPGVRAGRGVVEELRAADGAAGAC